MNNVGDFPLNPRLGSVYRLSDPLQLVELWHPMRARRINITAFFPEANPKSRTNALLSATTDLDDAELNEVRLYALFRKSRRLAKRTK